MALGVLAAEEEVGLTGAPEYTVALRTQLLVGAPTYAIAGQEEYQEAFRADDGDVMVQVGGGGAGGGWGVGGGR